MDGRRAGPLPRHRPVRFGQEGPARGRVGRAAVLAVDRGRPESGAALRSWHAAHLAADAPDLAVRVAGELLATATLTTTRREAFLAFTMDARRARAQVRAAGGGDLGAAAGLVRRLRGLHQALGRA